LSQYFIQGSKMYLTVLSSDIRGDNKNTK